MKARWKMALCSLLVTGCGAESDPWPPIHLAAGPFIDVLGDIVGTLYLQHPTQVRALSSLECDGDKACKDDVPQSKTCTLDDPTVRPEFADAYTQCLLRCGELEECFVQALAAVPTTTPEGTPRPCNMRTEECQIATDACVALSISISPTLATAIQACLDQDCVEMDRCLAKAVLQDGRETDAGM